MHLRRLWIVLGLFATFAAGAAVVYKWTDKDGVVHYSDQAVPGAERVVTSSGSGNGIGGPTSAVRVGAPPTKVASGLGYSVVNIESPIAEQVFFGDEVVPIRIHLEPSLKPDHSLTWQLNGKPLDEQANVTAFSLQLLPRGTYSVAATLTDPTSGVTQSANSVTFYVRQPSQLAPLNKTH
jgi:hypothetical protein